MNKEDSMNVIEPIVQKMSRLSTSQRKFLVIVLTTIHLLRGKMTFRNMRRYSDLHEKTFSRHFRQSVDVASMNHLALTTFLPPGIPVVAAIDTTTTSKSGSCTYGLDLFSNSSHSRPEQCGEFSELALVDVTYNTAYHLSTLPTPDTDTMTTLLGADGSRMDWYLVHLRQDMGLCPRGVTHLAADGAYAKQKFVDGVCEWALHLISTLRHDANLRFLYTGPRQKRRGAPKKYDGKVTFQELSRFTPITVSDDVTLYAAVVNSVSLKRTIRLVYVWKQQGKNLLTALLFSTDTELDAELIYRYYTARFQIEFLIRDAKQFTGVGDFQVCSQRKIAFHVNVSMTALNFLKREDRLTTQETSNASQERTDHVISISSWKTRKFNEHQVEGIISTLGLDLSSLKIHPEYENLINYGAIAA